MPLVLVIQFCQSSRHDLLEVTTQKCSDKLRSELMWIILSIIYIYFNFTEEDNNYDYVSMYKSYEVKCNCQSLPSLLSESCG